MLAVNRQRLAEWVGHAQLLTVRDIDGRAAEILYQIGIRGLVDLAASTAEELTRRYNARVEKVARATLRPIDDKRVGGWIRAAQAYVGRQEKNATPQSSTGR